MLANSKNKQKSSFVSQIVVEIVEDRSIHMRSTSLHTVERSGSGTLYNEESTATARVRSIIGSCKRISLCILVSVIKLICQAVKSWKFPVLFVTIKSVPNNKKILFQRKTGIFHRNIYLSTSSFIK